MNNGFSKMMLGQGLLIVCCVFYLIWWSISYRPDTAVNRAGGLNGILLLITAVSGIAGGVMTLTGIQAMPGAGRWNGNHILIGWICAYLILLLVTWGLLRRPVTTELILITGWAALELTVISSLSGAGRLTDLRFWILAAVIAIAFLISMILYVLYYRMEPMKAFYAAMVPLITEAVSMGILLLTVLTQGTPGK